MPTKTFPSILFFPLRKQSVETMYSKRVDYLNFLSRYFEGRDCPYLEYSFHLVK